jgi:aryl-alcohol dehydrogenase-like predicted oxidoreductase
MHLVNKIVLGTAQFGLKYGVNNESGKPSLGSVFEILNETYSRGIRILDTAEAYGDAHGIIGEFHRANSKKIFKTISKLPHDFKGDFEDKIELYLRQLSIDFLEALMFHSYQSYEHHREKMDRMIRARNDGKIKFLGVSVYTNKEAKAVIEDDRIDLIQLPFNLFDNNNLRGEILRCAKDRGKIIHTRSAFLQGLFFLPRNTGNKIAVALSSEIDSVRRLSEEEKLPLQTIALNYCLQKEHIDGVLIGIDNVEQLKDNLQFIEQALSNEIVAKIDKINIKDLNLLNPSLW